MEGIKLIVDPSSNLKSDSKSNSMVVPLIINLGNRTFLDNDQMDYPAFLDKIYENKEKSGTSCPNLQEWLDALADSKKAIILTLTGGLSGTYSSTKQTAEVYQEENSDSEALVLDPRSAGSEPKLLVDKLIKLVQNTSFNSIGESTKTYQASTYLLFSSESLRNLVVNGRISSVAARIAGMLHIRMIGEASAEGTFEPLGKARRSKKIVLELFENMEKQSYPGGKVYIDHVDNLKDAESLKEKINEKYPEAQIEIGICHGLCSSCAEKGGLMVGSENQAAFFVN